MLLFTSIVLPTSTLLALTLLLAAVVPVPTDSVNCMLRPEQSVAVQGQLVCHGRPVEGLKVQLYEMDVLKDDMMAQGKTDSRGRFELKGSGCEFGSIAPRLDIYHRCTANKGAKVCTRKLSINVPKQYIHKGKRPKNIYNLFRRELSKQANDKEDPCIS